MNSADTSRSPIDTASCHAGTSPEGSRIIMATGDVHGKSDTATATGPRGWSRMADSAKNGDRALRLMSAVHWFASW